MAKRLQDIQGFEYDWLACDADGQAGFFSTAGGGYAPGELPEDTDSYDQAIAALLAAPATTTARFAPEVAAGCVNTWQQMAERGLFAYDSDDSGGPYRLVAAPETAARLPDLPVPAAEVIRRVHFQNLRFADLTEVTGAQLALR